MSYNLVSIHAFFIFIWCSLADDRLNNFCPSFVAVAERMDNFSDIKILEKGFSNGTTVSCFPPGDWEEIPVTSVNYYSCGVQKAWWVLLISLPVCLLHMCFSNGRTMTICIMYEIQCFICRYSVPLCNMNDGSASTPICGDSWTPAQSSRTIPSLTPLWNPSMWLLANVRDLHYAVFPALKSVLDVPS